MSAIRMQHYATYLQAFGYEIRFKKSKDHANADTMSRISLPQADPGIVIEEAGVIKLNQVETLPITATELVQATAKDQSVRNPLQTIKYVKPDGPYGSIWRGTNGVFTSQRLFVTRNTSVRAECQYRNL